VTIKSKTNKATLEVVPSSPPVVVS